MKERIAVYAGTFDPVTNGHIDIIERAAKMYDKVYVTIFTNPNKKTLFSLKERLSLLNVATKHLKHVCIDASDDLAVSYAKKVHADVLVRGLRATMDFEYEYQLALSNQYLDPDIEMVFLMTKPTYSYISSSSVKEMASHHHSVKGLVCQEVEEALINKYQSRIVK